MSNINPKPAPYFSVFGDFGSDGIEAVCDGALTTRPQVIEKIREMVGDENAPARIHYIDIIAGRSQDSTAFFARELLNDEDERVQEWALRIFKVYHPEHFTAAAMHRRVFGEEQEAA